MRSYWLLIPAILFASLSCRDATNSTGDPNNNPPVVQDILVSPPSPVFLNSDVRLEAIAVDADGDELNYEWSVTGGTITLSHENKAYWQPNNLGVHTIRSAVSDGRSTGTRTISVNVKKK